MNIFFKETLKTMFEEAGFQQVTYESVHFGIIAIQTLFILTVPFNEVC
jgi:ubiquinone/menaquinone biosynthesis C-methylase UbiE